MVVLLPPILFSSTLRINKKIFFKNFGTILVFAFLGSLLAILSNTFFMWIFSVLGFGVKIPFIYCLIFSTIISATDPVSVLATLKENDLDKNLFSIIFGESILNDAISLAFYNGVILFGEEKGNGNFKIFGFSVLNFFVIIFVSILMGIFLGFLACLVLKKISAKTRRSEEKILQYKDFIKFYKKTEFERQNHIFNNDTNLIKENKNKIIEIPQKKPQKTIIEISEETRKILINSSENKKPKKSTFERFKSFEISPETQKILNFQNSKITELEEKFDNSLNHEIALMLIVPLLSYLISESLNYSGIISILFCGIFLSRYSLFNLNKKSFLILKKVITAVSDIFETVAFLIIGLSLFTFSFPEKKIGFFFFFANFCFLCFSRFVNVFVVSWILNFFRKKKICWKKKILIWFSGLRGAMSFALAIVNIDNKFGELFFSMTLFFALASTFVFGGIMPFLIKFLDIEKENENLDVKEKEDLNESRIVKISKNVERNLENYFKTNN